MRSILLLAGLAFLPTVTLGAPPTAKPVDIVLCIDTSGSMDGLIDSAKRKVWTLVNNLAKIEPTPELRVALYSYGNNRYPAAGGWVRQEIELTNDLDNVYKQLDALRTASGGSSEEYVARVAKAALSDLKWSTDKDALKLLFVCGNEPVDQDKEVSLTDVVALAKKQNVYLNTIYCGVATHVDAAGWETLAKDVGGKFATINQNEAAAEVAIKTPHDAELAKLSVKINETYVCYGDRGAAGAANQVAQDQNAAKIAPGVALERTATKASRLYKNSEWDLVDRMQTDKAFDLKKLKDSDLPEEMRKLKPEEREAFLKKKAEERATIQKQISELAAKRDAYIAAERKKLQAAKPEQGFDAALQTIIRDQAATKGLKIK